MVDVVSLFSGCGGSDAGVISAGFNVVFANDILPYAKDVYEANHTDIEFRREDVSTIRNFPQAELLIGCYPCQGFSQGGVRDPSRKVNKLYLEFARALSKIRPKAFIVENVSGMIRKNFKHLLEDQFKVFQDVGYTVSAEVLNAADFGVAQNRKRIFIVGIRDDFNLDFKFPTPSHGEKSENRKKTISDALQGMPEWPEGEFYDLEFHWYYLSRDRRNDWNDQSRTIVANPRHMPLHPISPIMKKFAHNDWRFVDDSPARRFSYREAAAIQGFENLIFPDTKAGSMQMRYTVIGNAVPPLLFKAVTEALPDIW